MEHSAYTGAPSLEELTDAFRRRWWLVAMCAILGICGALGYLRVAEPTYVSTAAVLVSPVGGAGDNVVDGARTNSLINLDTEAQIVKSQDVSKLAATDLGTSEVIGQLVKKVSVEVPANTNVLRISFTTGDPEDAAKGANAYAKAYLDNRTDLAEAVNLAQIDSLERRITKLQTKYDTAVGADKEIALSDLSAVKARYNALIGTAITPGKTISDALPPNRPASPDRPFVLLTGMALGVLVGLVLVAWLEHRDGRFYDWRVIERRLGLPVLSNIPGKKGKTAHLFAAHSPSGQAFVELRTALASGLTGSNNVVLLASPIRGHGLDMVVANLAASAARANITTAVVVVDDASHLTDLVGLPMGDGLADVLTGTTTLSAVSQPVPDIPGLTVIASGRDLNERVEDIEGAGILPVIKTLQQRSDLVLVLSAPHSESADAQFLGFHSDASIPVVEMAKVRRKALVLAVREWELVGTPVPGVVTVPAVSEPDPWPPPVRTGRKDKKS